MIKFMVATHGQLASGLVETLRMIVGLDHSVVYYCMPGDKSSDGLEHDLRELMSDWQTNRYIVFTDLMGGSVNNALTAMLLGEMDFELITGANLAMIISAVMSPANSAESLVDQALKDGKNSIIHINKMLRERR